MSLKDRFNGANAKNTKITKQEINISQYYLTSEEAQNAAALGVIDTLLEDDDINAIYVNGAKNIFIERKTKLHRSTVSYRDETQLQNIIKKYSTSDSDFIKFNYKQGINVTAFLPPLSDVSSLYVKCYRDKFATFENMEETQAISKEAAIFFEALARKRKNIIIAGAKKTFKTTFLSAIAKKMPINNRYSLIDFSGEIKTEKPNFTNFDLSNSEDKTKKEAVVKAIFSENPEGILLNDFDFDFDCMIKSLLNGQKGLILNINASSKEEAADKISIEILKLMPYLDFLSAKKMTHELFDFIIFLENREEKKVSSVSEFSFNEDSPVFNDIFLLNESMIHYSMGYVPAMFLENDIDSINLNIFNSDYKHTYSVAPFKDAGKKGLNPDILKKFKKDLSISSIENSAISQDDSCLCKQNAANIKTDLQTCAQENNIQNMPDENHNKEINNNMDIIYDEEFMKKAQEKFDEIRKNVNTDDADAT